MISYISERGILLKQALSASPWILFRILAKTGQNELRAARSIIMRPMYGPAGIGDCSNPQRLTGNSPYIYNAYLVSDKV
jgi:hypothetical protein